MPLNPQGRFQATDAAKFHADLVNKPAFHQAIEAALNQWMLRRGGLPHDNEFQSMAQAWKLVGIREFIDTLLTLAEPPPPEPKPIMQNLKAL